MNISEEEVKTFYEEATGHSGDELLDEEIRRIIEKVSTDVDIPDKTLDQIDEIIWDEINTRGNQ